MTLPPVILLIEYCSPAFHLLDKLINLKYEYNSYTGDERWAIITELSVKELWEKYPLVIERYSPFVHLSIAQGEVIDNTNRNEDKYAKRSSRTLDCYGYDDEMSSQFHKELAIMFDDPFERAEEERLTLQTSTSRQFFRLVKQLFEKRGRNGSPQSGN